MSPQVGVGVLIFNQGQLLLGRRKGSHGQGTWSLPGGHLEFGESLEQCASRETLEETGLSLERCIKGPYVNNVFSDVNKHYLTVFMISGQFTGEPQQREPEKCDGWMWFDIDALPSPLFPPLATLLNEHPLAELRAIALSCSC